MHGVTFPDELNCIAHIRNICQIVSFQISALGRFSRNFFEQCRINVYRSFINSDYNYCPTVWGKTTLTKLAKLQERTQAVLHGDSSHDYDGMLQSGQLRIQINLICLIAMEMFECTRRINPTYMNEMFTAKSPNTTYKTRADCCNLRLTPKVMDTDSFDSLVPQSGILFQPALKIEKT